METVVELTGDERGVWRVITYGSSHIFNFERGTVTRIPGVGRGATINDQERPLRTLDRCRVGEMGRWTMHADNFFTEFYWQRTTAIQRIELLTGAARREAADEVALENINARDGLLEPIEVSLILGVDNDGLQQMVDAGLLIGFTWKERSVLPSIQLEFSPGRVRSFVKQLSSAAKNLNYSPRSLTIWLHEANAQLDGDQPFNHIDEPELLVATLHASVGFNS